MERAVPRARTPCIMLFVKARFIEQSRLMDEELLAFEDAERSRLHARLRQCPSAGCLGFLLRDDHRPISASAAAPAASLNYHGIMRVVSPLAKAGVYSHM